ncbi:MAG TPA: Na+/H+ antiporter subunit E [Myxococcota bacterium]|nr:Na+/H+ antiporter subunit E [Myxococcota bacterium]
MLRSLLLFSVLLSTWFLWSGHTEPMLLGFGAGSSLAIVLLVWRMEGSNHDRTPLAVWVRVVIYFPWLAWEIVKSNLHVARMVLTPKAISPRLVRTKASQRTDFGRVLYANSITLTPGTITLDLRGDDLLVHALTKDTAEGLDGNMDRRCLWVEQGRQG